MCLKVPRWIFIPAYYKQWEMWNGTCREKKNERPIEENWYCQCASWNQITGKDRLSHLGEERARDKLFVLQKGDALAAIQLFGQVCHVRLQLCKAWKDIKKPRKTQKCLNHGTLKPQSCFWPFELHLLLSKMSQNSQVSQRPWDLWECLWF